ncbi:Small-conductance mechanosensitive channel [Erythrobacter sanguineus]|uniref:Small-conductance mechanosensitive channel n=1 Tax=Erythrobacter sanguineus TaxID=198312 RepID=A0A1M7RRJ8_9SPHN|nr:Small-conductance mechanosensitive channel [Erythrobacter sanguineus]
MAQPRLLKLLKDRQPDNRPIPSLHSLAALVAGLAFAACILIIPSTALHGQSLPDPASLAGIEQDAAPESEPIDIAALTQESDRDIAGGLMDIFAQIDGLSDVDVTVQSGVVTLEGTVTNQADREQASNIARRIAGVVTVENSIERTFELDSNLSPAIQALNDDLRTFVGSLPLFGVAVLVALLIAAAGYLLAAQRWLWKWVAPNAFLAELLSGAIRVIAIIAALIVALQILDAATLLGFVLGSAGIIGIAFSFAVRDTVDNYVSSLMLSLRQPFRANDHILIDDLEGHVIRLTSRATVLMTLDGNHLRIPNSTVFKANILNYTRNPQRRFEFDLGVDSADDPLGAMEVGLQAIRALPFVLDDPPSHSVIYAVGESSIVLRFFAWVDQRSTDFLKGRSLAIQAAKHAVEEAGYELPEPIYRIRMDDRGRQPTLAEEGRAGTRKPRPAPAPMDENAAPDRAVEKLVSEERGFTQEEDLLDNRKPIE